MKTRYFVRNTSNRCVVEDHDSGYAELDRPSQLDKLRRFIERHNEAIEIRDLCQNIMDRAEC